MWDSKKKQNFLLVLFRLDIRQQPPLTYMSLNRRQPVDRLQYTDTFED